jgi:serine/threonine protein kinase
MPDPTDPHVTTPADAHASAASDHDETASAPSRSGSASPTFGPPAAAGEVGTLGPYRVVKQLGAGGMGAVYLAVDTRLDRKLALKVMLPEFAADREAKERFLREARAAAKLHHDNVVTVYEADERGGVPYIAMLFLQGVPLDAYLKTKGAPALAHVIRIGRETALGLAAAHALGLVHRDIKPANLWLEAPNGRVKILDFGLAKPIGTDTELTKSGAVVGTPAYMSPEQARGSKVDHRTDLFSLGAVLYRLCTGKTPFAGPNMMAVMMALGMEDPTPVRELNPNVPEPLAELIHQLLAKKPEQRPQTATEVAKRLQGILSQLLAPSGPSVASSGSVPAVSGVDLSASQPVVVHAISHQPPIVVPMHVTVAPESVFANLGEASDAEATAAEPAPAAPKPERKKGGKGLLFAVGAAVLLAAGAVAVVVSQMGKKGEPTAEQKSPEAAPAVPAPPKDSGKPPPGSIPVLKPVGNEWVDVLALDEKLIGTPPDRATWVKRNGELTSLVVPGRDNVVTLPVWATGSYNLVAEVRLDSGTDLIAFLLPLGNERTVGFDFNNASGTIRGFSGIDGKALLEVQSPTRTPQKPAPVGRVFKITIAVKITDRQVELQATVDNEPPIRWTGLVTNIRYPNNSQGQLGLYAQNTQWTVHSLKFQKIDGEAGVIGWGPPGSDPDRKAAEWVLSVGGSVRVNGEGRDITDAAGLPKEWFTLTHSNLHGTAVTDAGLAHFKSCKGLTWLNLGGTAVTDAGLAHFKDCKSLTELHLPNTKVTDTGLANFKDCKSLTTLFLYGTQVTDAGLAHLKELNSLHHLNLTGTQVTGAGLVHLKGLAALKELTLANSAVTDAGLAYLKELKSLTTLFLAGTSISDAGVEHLKELKDLTFLQLVNTKVSDAGMAHLKELKSLTGLYLPNTPVTDVGLAHLKEHKFLRDLRLDGTKMTDAGLEHLKGLKSLVFLSVRQTKVTAKGVADLAAALPGCRIEHDGGVIEPKVVADVDRKAAEWVLSVGGGVGVNGEDREIKAAAELPKGPFSLTGVKLEGNKAVTDASLAQLKDCKNLMGLYFQGTAVTDLGLAHLKDCKSVLGIHLDNTKVTDLGLAHLKDWKKLLYLNLDGTDVTDTGLAHFKDCKNLKELFVKGTKVTAKGLAELAVALPGCTIEHDGGTIEPKK